MHAITAPARNPRAYYAKQMVPLPSEQLHFTLNPISSFGNSPSLFEDTLKVTFPKCYP